MGNTPAFQYYPADLIADPELLTWDMETIGCYWMMISYLWINSGKIEKNPENLCKIFRKNHKKIAEKFWKNIEKKFELKEGFITHKRVTKEMQRQADNKLRRQNAGQKGGLAKAQNRSNAKTPTVAKRSPSSSTTPSPSTIVKYSEDFLSFWALYPNRLNKKKAYIAWRKEVNSELDAVLSGLDRYKKNVWKNTEPKYIPHPTTWLNGRQWEDEVGSKPAKPAPQGETLTEEQRMERARA